MKHLAMAVVVKKDKILVQKRYHTEKGPMTEFPGGAVNMDESGTDAAIRGLALETGITGLSHTATYTRVNTHGGRTYFVILRAQDNVEPAVERASSSEFTWLSMQEVTKMPFHPVERDFINQYSAALV